MIKRQKDSLRDEYRDRLANMEAGEKARRDLALCNAAESLVSFRFAEYVLLYAATAGEIDVTPIALTAMAKGKKILYPRCDAANHLMTYHIVSSPDELVQVEDGTYEPSPDAPIYDPSVQTGGAVCFVPGLVFDREGYRLGYGRGFYDRYLSAFSGCSIGVVYSDYILGEVPRGRYDVSVDILLTENGVRVTKKSRGNGKG